MTLFATIFAALALLVPSCGGPPDSDASISDDGGSPAPIDSGPARADGGPPEPLDPWLTIEATLPDGAPQTAIVPATCDRIGSSIQGDSDDGETHVRISFVELGAASASLYPAVAQIYFEDGFATRENLGTIGGFVMGGDFGGSAYRWDYACTDHGSGAIVGGLLDVSIDCVPRVAEPVQDSYRPQRVTARGGASCP